MSDCRHASIDPYGCYCDDCGKNCDDIIASLQSRIKELDCALQTRELEWKELCQHYDTLKARNEELEEALLEAATDIEGWGQYAGAYFQEKHGLDDDVAKYRSIANRGQENEPRR